MMELRNLPYLHELENRAGVNGRSETVPRVPTYYLRIRLQVAEVSNKTTNENNYKKIHSFVLCNEAFSGQHNIPNNYIICSTNSMIA